jgi:hypothetical protein
LPGGIQAITIQDRLLQTYRREVDLMRRYVFPGGHVALLKSLGERCSVPVIRERIFGQDYAKTRASWRNNFRATSPHLMPSGFDDRFRRLSGILPRLLPGEIPVGKYRGAPGGVRKVESHNRVQNRLSLLPRAL